MRLGVQDGARVEEWLYRQCIAVSFALMALNYVRVGRDVPEVLLGKQIKSLRREQDNFDRTSLQRQDLDSQFSKSGVMSKKHSVFWSLGIDLPLFFLVPLLITLFELGLFPTTKSGFFCNDLTLSYDFTGDTVSFVVIMLSIFIIPLVIILPTELIFLDANYLHRTRIHQAVINTLWLFRSYGYGLFLNLSVVEVMKCVAGSPRPTFFKICEPDTLKTCNGSEWVSTFQCTSTKYSRWLQTDSYHSFPSGHTSLSVYCGFFVAWYLQKRAFDWRHRTIFIVPVLQLFCMTYAVICSLTRMTDHRHHWWDVTVGTVIGVVSFVYAACVLCDNFSYAKNKSGDVAREESRQTNVLLYDGMRREIV